MEASGRAASKATDIQWAPLLTKGIILAGTVGVAVAAGSFVGVAAGTSALMGIGALGANTVAMKLSPSCPVQIIACIAAAALAISAAAAAMIFLGANAITFVAAATLAGKVMAPAALFDFAVAKHARGNFKAANPAFLF